MTGQRNAGVTDAQVSEAIAAAFGRGQRARSLEQARLDEAIARAFTAPAADARFTALREAEAAHTAASPSSAPRMPARVPADGVDTDALIAEVFRRDAKGKR